MLFKLKIKNGFLVKDGSTGLITNMFLGADAENKADLAIKENKPLKADIKEIRTDNGQYKRRYDTLKLNVKHDALEVTAQGFLKVKGFATRTGIFDYYRGDQLTRELRPENEVYRPDTLNSLMNLPLTSLHPNELVTIDNVKKYQKGFTGENLFFQDDLIGLTITITDQELIKDIQAGKMTELSCGYTCRVIDAGGAHSEGNYNSMQTDIIYNHLAVVPQGRAGHRAKLLLDSKNNAFFENENININNRGGKMPEIKINGNIFEVDKALKIAFDSMVKDQETKEIETSAKLDKAETDLKELTEKNDQLKTELETAKNINLDSLVTERQNIINKAVGFLPSDYKTDGLSNNEIKKAAVLNAYKSIKDIDQKIKKPGYIETAFDLLEVKKDSGFNAVLDSVNSSAGDLVQDAGQKARLEMIKRNQEKFNKYSVGV